MSKLQVLIPMAGLGSRFTQAGYTVPKPLLTIEGNYLIEFVINNFIKNFEHDKVKFSLIEFIIVYDSWIIPTQLLLDMSDRFDKKYKITLVDTEGIPHKGPVAACLFAQYALDSESQLIIMNCDQAISYPNWASLFAANIKVWDSCVMLFKNEEEMGQKTKWSYAKVDPYNNRISEIKEKLVISSYATTGIYGFKRSADFVKFAREMIEAGETVNGEFYVGPVFNYLLKSGRLCWAFYATANFIPLGTPEDYRKYLSERLK